MKNVEASVLQGKRAIVTGATLGVGKSIARSLAAHGCNVYLCSRDGDRVAATVKELAAEGARVEGQACDVGEHSEVESLISNAAQAMGGLDILINNAGVGIFADIEDMSPREWRTIIRTNLDSLFYCCHNALPLMKSAGGGFIINIGSLAGKHTLPSGAAYCASKFALVGFSEALMEEVRQDDIRVAYVMPGSIDTWFGGSRPHGDDSWKLSPQDLADVVIDTLTRHPRCLTSRIEMRPSKPPKR